VGHFVNGTPVMENLALGRHFGVIDLYVDPKTKKVLGDKTKIASGIEICETVDNALGTCDARRLKPYAADVKPVPAEFHGHIIAPDLALIDALEPARAQVATLQNQDLGLNVPVALGRNYESESPLGDVLADSLRAMMKADVAMMNPGGLRADLRGGPLKYGAVYEVIPFDNQIASLELTGEQLKRVLMAAFGGKKGVFQVSGVEVKLSRCPSPDRLKGFTLPGGKSVDPAGHYKVVMPDFLARGGDGLGPVLATIEHERVDLGDNRGNLRDELVAFWQDKKQPLIAPKTGRVAFVDQGDGCSAGAKIDPQHPVP
jgi:5'-nucleotidase